MAKKKTLIPPGDAWLPIDLVAPHPENPRVGYLPAIKEAMIANGWHGALVVQASTGRILAGNHRWMVAKEIGLKQVLAHVVDVDDKTALRILLADNRTADRATYDDPKLQGVLQMIIAEAPAEDVAAKEAALAGSGYTESDRQQLALGLSGGEPMAWGSQGTAEESREAYETSGVRQLVLILKPEEFDTVVPAVRAIAEKHGLESTTAVFLWLLERYQKAPVWLDEQIGAPA